MTPPIAHYEEDNLEIRGESIRSLVGGMTYAQMVLFTLTGERIDAIDNRAKMIDALLVAWADHGEIPPSTQNVMNAASCGVPFAHAMASGLSCFGVHHVPIEECVRFLQGMVARLGNEEMENAWMNHFRIIPGLGHPIHLLDPRGVPLWEVAVTTGFCGKHYEALEKTWKTIYAKKQQIHQPNVAGITAAIWLDMGLPPEAVGLIPVAGRAVGLAAHYAEQRKKPAFRGITKA